MTALVTTAALLVTAAALVCAGVALVVTRRLAVALPVLLDLLTAAGLLRLAAQVTPRSLTTAAVIIGLRHLAGAGIAAGRRAITSYAAVADRPVWRR